LKTEKQNEIRSLKGLNEREVEKSKELYGTNELAQKPKASILSMFLDACNNIWIKVLFAALIMKVIMILIGWSTGNDIYQVISIIVAIALSTGFSTLTEYKNTSRADALQEEYNRTYAKVMRSGKLVNILTSELVKGDVILIQAGDKVPVDGLLIKGHIAVSQAALNGESRDEKKFAAKDMLNAESTDYGSEDKVFMGSVVTSGEAYMVATVIGDESELGKINKSLTDTDAEERMDTSSLKLQKVAVMIGKLGAATIAVLLNIFMTVTGEGFVLSAAAVGMMAASYIMLFASIIIMAVPEGLPMMNSLVQGMNTEDMYKKHILVSHKAAFADSAYLNLLFSDKTGTITEGKLGLVEFILGNGLVTDAIQHEDFMKSLTLNNLAKVSAENTAVGSNNMDRALLTYALSHGYQDGQYDMDEVEEISGFDSEKKCATVTLKDGSVYWKGATENILDKVTHYLDCDGVKKEFTEYLKKAVVEKMDEQAKRTMKLLSVARITEDEVVLYAVLCLRDNVRKDALETVHTLNKAGIQVVMVTGDAEETAVAIAKEAGILCDESDVVLTHEMLEQMSDEEVAKALPNLKVVSRAKPLDKKRLVTIAQGLDDVVGMTGDGVNDSPALKQADIGFAMGDGTSVAQEAGDVVILNNSLTSIKDCVLNSRTMAKSVGKFLIFQLTVNVSTLLMNIIAPILGWGEPFNIVQILWINLIMDTLAALAFGKEPVLDRYMQEKPARRQDSILTKNIKTAIATAGIFITLGSVLILENVGGIVEYVTPAGVADSLLYERTFMFAFFIYAIIFNSFNTRSEKWNLFEHIGSNKNFLWVMGGIFIMQTIIIQIGGSVFHTCPLTAKALVTAMLLGLLVIPVDMVRKIFVNRN
jgi:Ca2+-transporting ATPase